MCVLSYWEVEKAVAGLRGGWPYRCYKAVDGAAVPVPRPRFPLIIQMGYLISGFETENEPPGRTQPLQQRCCLRHWNRPPTY